jgi:hypothetical protein
MYQLMIYVKRKPSDEAIGEVEERLKRDGCEPVHSDLCYARKETVLRLAKPKIHMWAPTSKGWLCSSQRISRRRITKDPEKVTCLICKKRLEEAKELVDQTCG